VSAVPLFPQGIRDTELHLIHTRAGEGDRGRHRLGRLIHHSGHHVAINDPLRGERPVAAAETAVNVTAVFAANTDPLAGPVIVTSGVSQVFTCTSNAPTSHALIYCEAHVLLGRPVSRVGSSTRHCGQR